MLPCSDCARVLMEICLVASGSSSSSSSSSTEISLLRLFVAGGLLLLLLLLLSLTSDLFWLPLLFKASLLLVLLLIALGELSFISNVQFSSSSPLPAECCDVGRLFLGLDELFVAESSMISVLFSSSSSSSLSPPSVVS